MIKQNNELLAASCRMALAAYLHDLGKFAERAKLEVSKEQLDAHITQYCPFRVTEANGKGYHSHKHAAYTGFAFDIIEKNAPHLINGDMTPFVNRAQLQNGQNAAIDSLINAAASHHKPETFLQWIIATADRVASGFERQEFEAYNLASDEAPEKAKNKTGKNHYQARQLSLFEQIRLSNQSPAASSANDLAWRYPLKALSAHAIFPQAKTVCEPSENDVAQKEYLELWNEFVAGLAKIPNSHRENWALWLDHFDTAWLTFTQAIPAATAFGTKPEVSLYDHSKATSAIATALWRWHFENNRCSTEDAEKIAARADWDDKKLLLIQGDFFGIQEFIFSDGSETNKAAAKLLRGRSFQVSMFTELAAVKVLDALSLPSTNQMMNAAGKFLIVAPNTDAVKSKIKELSEEINQWFLKHSFGMAGLGLIAKPCSCNDFLKGQFKNLMQGLFADLERVKLQRFSLLGNTNSVLEADYSLGSCQYNSRLPADNNEGSCALSRDQIKLGQSIVKKDRLLVLRNKDDLNGRNIESLELDVFGLAVAFTNSEEISGKFGQLAKDNILMRCWDYSLPDNFTTVLWNGYARRFINAYVPEFTDFDLQTSDKYTGLDEDEMAQISIGAGKTFNHIACEDRSCPRNPNEWQGQVALMTLKGDIDNLGNIFQKGLSEPTFAKMASLSRQVNAFFAIWLPAICAKKYPNTYTVFAGGDDFFLIGPWLSTQKLAAEMAAEFKNYVAQNSEIHFSAGMVMTKPGQPIHALANAAEEALEKAKGNDGKKNAVTLFDTKVSWTDWPKIEAADSELLRVKTTYGLSTSYVYSLLQLIDLSCDDKNPEQAMWRSRFAYKTRRYVVDKLDKAIRPSAQMDLASTLGANGIEVLGKAYKLPLFNYFYQQR